MLFWDTTCCLFSVISSSVCDSLPQPSRDTNRSMEKSPAQNSGWGERQDRDLYCFSTRGERVVGGVGWCGEGRSKWKHASRLEENSSSDLEHVGKIFWHWNRGTVSITKNKAGSSLYSVKCPWGQRGILQLWRWQINILRLCLNLLPPRRGISDPHRTPGPQDLMAVSSDLFLITGNWPKLLRKTEKYLKKESAVP